MIGLMWRSVDHPGKLIFSPDLSLSRYRRRRGTFTKGMFLDFPKAALLLCPLEFRG